MIKSLGGAYTLCGIHLIAHESESIMSMLHVVLPPIICLINPKRHYPWPKIAPLALAFPPEHSNPSRYICHE
jgi:hypothetical protein